MIVLMLIVVIALNGCSGGYKIYVSPREPYETVTSYKERCRETVRRGKKKQKAIIRSEIRKIGRAFRSLKTR